MLSIFRTNQLMASFLLVFYAAALRFWGLVYLEPWEPTGTGIFSDWVYDQIGYSGIVPAIVATLLVFIEGWMINALVLRDRLGRDANLFPGLFFILNFRLYIWLTSSTS